MKQKNSFCRPSAWAIAWLSLVLFLVFGPGQQLLAQEDISGDVNGDGVVDIFDLAFIATKYGSADPAADANGDGRVDIFDLSLVAGQYNPQEVVEPQIIGGHEAKPGEYPWQVGLYGVNGKRPFCGGSLIRKDWVLTAAHCAADREGNTFDPESFVIILGDLNTQEEEGTEQRRKVSKVIPHPDFRLESFEADDIVVAHNDIALLKLDSPVALSGAVQPIPLNTNPDTVNALATVTGWGDFHPAPETLIASDILRKVFVPVVSNETCNGPASYKGHITESMLCAGLTRGGRDSCQGDSGGPLVIYDSTRGRWVLAGVVSFGEGCAQPNFYGVYSRVSSFTGWINSQAGPDQPPPTPVPYYYLTGRVTELVRPYHAYGYIRQPIYGVTVQATSSNGRVYTTMTRYGSFAFRLPAGSYTIRPLKYGYSFWPPAATVDLRYNTSAFFTGHRRYGVWGAQAEAVESGEGNFLGGEVGPVQAAGEADIATTGDVTPPQLSLDSPANETIVGRVLRIEGVAADEDSGLERVELWLDDESEPHLAQLDGDRYSLEFETGPYRDGEHNLMVIAYDQAGNLKAEVRTLFIDNGQGQDTSPPEVSVDNLADEARISGLFTLDGQATDDSGGVERVEIWLDDAAEPALARLEGDHYTWDFQAEGAGEGQHTVAIIAYDTAGNSNGQVRSFWMER